MSIEKGKEWYIEYCQEMYDKNVPEEVAMTLSTLMQAEEENLIKRSWRSQLDVDAMISFIINNQAKIKQEWDSEYKRLKQILDYGGGMEYEEMMIILSRRSNIESELKFTDETPIKLLANLDEDLRDVLKINRDEVRDCRNAARNNVGCLPSYLPNHWWWRYDEEN